MTKEFKVFTLQDARVWMLIGFGFIILGCAGLVGNLVLKTWDYLVTFAVMGFMGLMLMKVASNYYVHLFREKADSDGPM
jgi:hypothetical protein